MPVALTDMRLTKLEVLCSPDRIEARGHHTATGNTRGQRQKAGAFTGEDTRRGGQKTSRVETRKTVHELVLEGLA